MIKTFDDLWKEIIKQNPKWVDENFDIHIRAKGIKKLAKLCYDKGNQNGIYGERDFKEKIDKVNSKNDLKDMEDLFPWIKNDNNSK